MAVHNRVLSIEKQSGQSSEPHENRLKQLVSVLNIMNSDPKGYALILTTIERSRLIKMSENADFLQIVMQISEPIPCSRIDLVLSG